MTHKWFFIASVVCIAATMGFTSCDEDEKTELKETTTIIDDEAGTFVLKNLVTGVEISATENVFFNGDSLQIIFTPKDDYKAKTFNVTCTIDNEDVAVTDGIVHLRAGAGMHELKCSAVSKQASGEDGKTSLVWSAEKRVELQSPESYANVPLDISISNDLFQFVTATISYTDATGTTHTHAIADSEWERPDSVSIYKFTDAAGKEHYRTSGGKPFEGEEDMTLTSETKFLPPCTYTFNARYNGIEHTSNVTLRYQLRQGVTADRERYYFSHSLKKGSPATIVAPGLLFFDASTTINIGFNFGGDAYTKREDVQRYLDELVATPDILRYQISKTGVKEL